MMPIYFYESDIGKIGIAEKYGRITNVYSANDKLPLLSIFYVYK